MSSSTVSPKDRFDALAPEYDRWDAEHRAVAKHRRTLLQPLRGSILEVGVGTGLNLPCYRQGADVIACDISGKMLKQAASRLSQLGEHRIKLVKMDAQKLPFLDGTFDAVVGTFLFCSVEKPGRVAREIRRVLKPGGRFVTLGYGTARDLKRLGRAGLEIVSTKEWPSDDHPIGQIIAQRAIIETLPAPNDPSDIEANLNVSDRKQMKLKRKNSGQSGIRVGPSS